VPPPPNEILISPCQRSSHGILLRVYSYSGCRSGRLRVRLRRGDLWRLAEAPCRQIVEAPQPSRIRIIAVCH